MGWGKALLEGAAKVVGHTIEKDKYVRCIICKGSKKYKNKTCKYCNGTGSQKIQQC